MAASSPYWPFQMTESRLPRCGAAPAISVARADGGSAITGWRPDLDAPNLLADSEDDDRNPAFGVSSQGTLILLYHRQHNYDADGNYQGGVRISDRKPVALMATRSFDNGLTWEEPYPLSIDALPTGSPYGKIVSLDDGTLLVPIYNSLAWADEQSDQTV